MRHERGDVRRRKRRMERKMRLESTVEEGGRAIVINARGQTVASGAGKWSKWFPSGPSKVESFSQ
jgi:hypothetical protein